MSLFKNPLKELDTYKELEEAFLNTNKIYELVDLNEPAKLHFISEFLKDKKSWKLIITYDDIKLRQMYENLSCFCENIILYPAKDLLFFYADVEGHLISKERITALKNIINQDSGIVLTTIDALMDKIELSDVFIDNILKINIEDEINLEILTQDLIKLGYERVSEIEVMGTFSIRGGIVDIYPLTEELPIRIELWGDSIDSIRRFEIETQRSIENINEVSIYPAKEKVFKPKFSILDYFNKEDLLIFIDEVNNTYLRAKEIEEEFKIALEIGLNSGKIDKSELIDIYSLEEIFSILSQRSILILNSLQQSVNFLTIERTFSIKAKLGTVYKNSFEILIKDLKKFKKLKYRVVLLTASKSRARRLADNLREYDLLAFSALDDKKDIEILPSQILVLYGSIDKGFEYSDLKFCLISESDIYSKSKAKAKPRKRTEKSNIISSLNELSIGDYIIHEEHGLGIYRGIEKIEIDDVIKDYLKLEYANNSNCYIPITKLDIIQKYRSAEGKELKLNKLASIEWTRSKNRAKKAIENMAKELIELYAKRLKAKPYIYPVDTVWQKEFEEMFPFEETKDQIKAIEDVKNDMQTDKIMDRLICGDVGYGKTEIAIRAAFKAVVESKQVMYLVPTTILAQQHYNNFVERMKHFPIKVDLLSRFRTKAEQKVVVDKFQKGMVDIIIGTHRLLSKDIKPKDLGLVIIDEEQRFGVKHKEKLKDLRNSVDVLTLTATPIPRTLHMSLIGIRDLSILEEAPIDRLPIQTYVMEFNEVIVNEAIKRELKRKGQVYYVYNSVTSIEEFTNRLKKSLPFANISFAHGQMSENVLENIMLDFINGKIDVLVSTTIIETGLDIANANTIIIYDADKFGLSQLYQLRGRVGRSKRAGYAFMLYKKDKRLRQEAVKRLKAIREFTELGSGIKIAMRDLEIRGAGNILGKQQHGHMLTIGYDLYCKLLKAEIQNLRGLDTTEYEFETVVESPIDAYIPSSYIENEELKLDIYKKIVSIANEEDFISIQEELIDRFGDYTREVENLLNIAKVKAMAHSVYIKELYINQKEIRFIFYENANLSPELIVEFVKENFLNINTKDKIELTYKNKEKNLEFKKLFSLAEDILQKLAKKMA